MKHDKADCGMLCPLVLQTAEASNANKRQKKHITVEIQFGKWDQLEAIKG